LSKILSISQGKLDMLAKYAKDAFPLESCALLLGKGEYPADIVYDLILLRNNDRSKNSFSIDPSDLFCAYQRASRLGLGIVGIFHSHPSLPQPSQKDKKFMRLNPIVWLIYSTLNHKYSAFLYCGAMIQVQITLIKE
jgi:[CysO sulfur-carrier protein]-S-L-cysteine hydrolase